MSFFERLVRVLFPLRCVFCGRLLDADSGIEICSNCMGELHFTGKKVVKPDPGGSAGGYDAIICVCRYTGILKESLIRFKFYNKPGYCRTFSKLLADRIMNLEEALSFDMVMGVPLHRKKETARGYNQAYLISKSLGKELDLPECSQLVERVRYTDAQSLLNKDERLRNVKGAFRVTDPEKVSGKSVLLVDDILTTGCTLNECGLALKGAGAVSVTAAVVASGRSL